MFDLDAVLCITLGLLILISAGLSLHPKNYYSRQVKVLKAFPRIIVGIQFIVLPTLANDIVIVTPTGNPFTVATELRAVAWALVILFGSEVLVQLMNILYGRAEVRK